MQATQSETVRDENRLPHSPPLPSSCVVQPLRFSQLLREKGVGVSRLLLLVALSLSKGPLSCAPVFLQPPSWRLSTERGIESFVARRCWTPTTQQCVLVVVEYLVRIEDTWR